MLGELRELLDVEPSDAGFRKICCYFLGFKESHEDMGVALDYAIQHLAHWPVECRHMCLDTPFVGELHPSARLVRSLMIRQANQESFPFWHFLLHPYFSEVQKLQFGNIYLHDRGVIRLATSPYMKNLRYLDLTHHDVSDVGVRALAKSVYINDLHSLYLGHNIKITDKGLLAWIESGKLAMMGCLSLRNTDVGDKSIVALANCPDVGQLRELDVRSTGMSSDGESALINSPFLSPVAKEEYVERRNLRVATEMDMLFGFGGIGQ